MKRLLLAALSVAGMITARGVNAQSLPNPILFVTQVPIPSDSANVASLFGNHGANITDAPRGGGLWIIYPDKSLKNLTRAAGYGVDGLQGAGAIAVREPSVHWSGTKALFSMIVGAPKGKGDTSTFYWQIYEITGLGESETPVITKVPNQPEMFNNVSPIYGTDDRIIFTSDRPRNGQRHLYPSFDEYKGTHTNTGLWSLDPATGNLFMLDNSPSGDFSPTIDSYGRVLVMRWDRLQRDRNADLDALGTGSKGTFNYTDESAAAAPQFGVRTEIFPEPQGSRSDLLNGTNMVGFEFNQFFPWQINEDGTSPETLNHIGRHDMRPGVNRAITDDPNVVVFTAAGSGRRNTNAILNFTQVKEDPTRPGTYFGVDALQSGTHSGGQIVSLNAAPTLDPNETVVSYVTSRATQGVGPETGNPPAGHSGFYRDPLPLSNGMLLAAHSGDPRADKNIGTRSNPVSRFDYRLAMVKQSGSVWITDSTLTPGISGSVSWWDPSVLVQYNGALWELSPVEVRARTRPARRASTLPAPERRVLDEAGVDEAKFRAWMADNDLAVTVTRDVTHRDAADRQQPFYLHVPGGRQTPSATGKVYDVSHFQFLQGDYIRGNGLLTQGGAPHEGRRILAVPMHDAVAMNPSSEGGPAGSVKVASDGSTASFVPARHAVTWQLVSPNGAPVVRERYWVTFQPGEIRVCASCHGTNDAATTPWNPIPQNKPEAFQELIDNWKQMVLPAHARLIAPANGLQNVAVDGGLRWEVDTRASGYRVQVSETPSFSQTALDRTVAGTDTIGYDGLAQNRQYYWRVRSAGKYGDADWSDVWSFTTTGSAMAAPGLVTPLNGSTGLTRLLMMSWLPVNGAVSYHLQIAESADFAAPTLDVPALADTFYAWSGMRPGHRYYWRVAAKGGVAAGPWSDTWSFASDAESGVADEGAALGAGTSMSVHPDPFNGSAAIELTKRSEGRAVLTLVDQRGAELARLFDGILPAGPRRLDLRLDEQGLGDLPSGVYLLRLDADGARVTRLVHLVR